MGDLNMTNINRWPLSVSKYSVSYYIHNKLYSNPIFSIQNQCDNHARPISYCNRPDRPIQRLPSPRGKIDIRSHRPRWEKNHSAYQRSCCSSPSARYSNLLRSTSTMDAKPLPWMAPYDYITCSAAEGPLVWRGKLWCTDLRGTWARLSEWWCAC